MTVYSTAFKWWNNLNKSSLSVSVAWYFNIRPKGLWLKKMKIILPSSHYLSLELLIFQRCGLINAMVFANNVNNACYENLFAHSIAVMKPQW